jgi:hypothetical protein
LTLIFGTRVAYLVGMNNTNKLTETKAAIWIRKIARLQSPTNFEIYAWLADRGFQGEDAEDVLDRADVSFSPEQTERGIVFRAVAVER